MTDTSSDDLIRKSVERLLADTVSPQRTVSVEAAGIDDAAWQGLGQLGLVGPDAATLDLRDVAGVVQAIAEAAALVPYTDAQGLAGWLAAAAGIELGANEVAGLLVAQAATARRASSGESSGATFEVGIAGARVPWGRFCQRVLVSFEHDGQARVGSVAATALRLQAAVNVAGEPLDRCGAGAVTLDNVVVVDQAFGPSGVLHRAALLRSAAMLGAMGRIHTLAITYAGDRKQFGRSLSQFQVIQSYLAEMAGEIAATSAMLEGCLLGVGAAGGPAAPDAAEVAALRVRAGLAAQRVAALGHQIHGAIGFTQDYPLHLWSRRLWAWREQNGNDHAWRLRLGRQMIAAGGDAWRTRITG